MVVGIVQARNQVAQVVRVVQVVDMERKGPLQGPLQVLLSVEGRDQVAQVVQVAQAVQVVVMVRKGQLWLLALPKLYKWSEVRLLSIEINPLVVAQVVQVIKVKEDQGDTVNEEWLRLQQLKLDIR